MQKIFKFLAVFSVFGQILGSDSIDRFDRSHQYREKEKKRNQERNFARREKESSFEQLDTLQVSSGKKNKR